MITGCFGDSSQIGRKVYAHQDDFVSDLQPAIKHQVFVFFFVSFFFSQWIFNELSNI